MGRRPIRKDFGNVCGKRVELCNGYWRTSRWSTKGMGGSGFVQIVAQEERQGEVYKKSGSKMGTWGRTVQRSLENHLGVTPSQQRIKGFKIATPEQRRVPTSDRLSRQGLVHPVRNYPLGEISRESVEHVFFHCREMKAPYAFWIVLANK